MHNSVDALLKSDRISGSGYQRVGGSIACVLTRFHLRSVLSVPKMIWFHRHVRRATRKAIPGFLRSTLLFEGPKTLCTLSLWRDDESIVQFGRIEAHVAAGNWVVKACRRENGRLGICSTQWRLWAVSHNLQWADLDLREIVAGQMATSSKDVGLNVAELIKRFAEQAQSERQDV